MFQVIVFVPETHKDKVKTAMFSAGAGKWGNYDSCCLNIMVLGSLGLSVTVSHSLGPMGKLNLFKR